MIKKINITANLISLTLIFSIILFSGCVSALPDISQLTQNTIDGIKSVWTPIFSALFGLYSSDEFLFTKILIFILLFVLVKAGVKAVPSIGEKNGITNIIALVVSLIAVRYISENQLTRSILLPYGTLGIALTTILPFIIFFFFVNGWNSGTARKFAWILFFVVMTGLWFFKSDVNDTYGNYLYISIMVLSFLMIWLDDKVKEYFDISIVKKDIKKMDDDQIRELKKKLMEWKQIQAMEDFKDPKTNRAVKDAEDALKHALKNS